MPIQWSFLAQTLSHAAWEVHLLVFTFSEKLLYSVQQYSNTSMRHKDVAQVVLKYDIGLGRLQICKFSLTSVMRFYFTVQFTVLLTFILY